MDTYIHSLINALKHSQVRAGYYAQTGDIRFLNESSDWIDVANIYMKEIKNAQTCEVEDGTYCS